MPRRLGLHREPNAPGRGGYEINNDNNSNNNNINNHNDNDNSSNNTHIDTDGNNNDINGHLIGITCDGHALSSHKFFDTLICFGNK